MNGLATALDTAADRCFQTIKRSVAAPSPEYWRTTSFYQKRICEKYLTVPEPEAAQPQDLAVIGHGDDLLYWIHALACTHILPHNLRLFNLRDGGVQFDATALFNLKRRRCSTSAAVVFSSARHIHGWKARDYLEVPNKNHAIEICTPKVITFGVHISHWG